MTDRQPEVRPEQVKLVSVLTTDPRVPAVSDSMLLMQAAHRAEDSALQARLSAEVRTGHAHFPLCSPSWKVSSCFEHVALSWLHKAGEGPGLLAPTRVGGKCMAAIRSLSPGPLSRHPESGESS